MTVASAVKPRMLAPRTRTTSIAIFISKASTFLPRYSGVRPTISPAMKTERIAPMTSIPYRPAPMPPGVISPSSMLNSGTSPPMGWKLSCQALIAPVLVLVVIAAHRPPEAGSEPDLLALHVAEGLVDAGREERVAGRLGVHRDDGADEEDRGHRAEDRPALALVAGHTGRT